MTRTPSSGSRGGSARPGARRHISQDRQRTAQTSQQAPRPRGANGPRSVGGLTPNSWTAIDTSAKALAGRVRFAQIVGVIIIAMLVGRLFWIQVWAGPDLAAKAASQRTVEVVDPARRGEIRDRNGASLAFTMEARSLTVHPNRLRALLDERHDLWPNDYPDADTRMEQIAEELPKMLGRDSGSQNPDRPDSSQIKSSEILDKLKDEKSTYEVLVRNVDPVTARKITDKFDEITSERQDIREYPNGAVGSNIIGKIGMDGVGQYGFEASRDAYLQGINGGRVVDIAQNGIAIPGSTRDQRDPIDGTSYNLTIDADMQYFVQQQLEQAKANSGAKNASAVVLDAKTGQILSMAQSDSVNPNKDIGAQVKKGKDISNIAVTSPFEPGSVAKMITAAGAVEYGLTTPDEVHTVPGSIEMSGVTVKDAWEHGNVRYTTTGIFGKSSNVGTLMLAQKLGEDRFADLLKKFGIGQLTGVELPGETQGLLPAREQWSGGTFANLPIGQGMSLSLLQMASVFQTMANDGVRIPPRIVASQTGPDGVTVPAEQPEGVRVVSPETAKTMNKMFQAVVQSAPGQTGTGPDAAVKGYQVAGKTGTAQKVDPKTGAYSNDKYWITFAGIAPADDPRFVIGIMLDEPKRGTDGGGGQSAAPLFRDLATWMLNRYNVPPSPPAQGTLMLEANN